MLQLLSPFAPHICEELWQVLGEKKSIIFAAWPSLTRPKPKDQTKIIVVQINGKLRDQFEILAIELTGKSQRKSARERGSSKMAGWPNTKESDLCVGKIGEYRYLKCSYTNSPNPNQVFLFCFEQFYYRRGRGATDKRLAALI